MGRLELEKQLHVLSQKYNEYNLPLYLSYPVESVWRQSVEPEEVRRYVEEPEDASVYVHIPFCRTACYYCCCNRVTGATEADMDGYLDRLNAELELKLSGRVRRLKSGSLHIGGGTPAYLTAPQLRRLMGLLERHVDLADGARIKLEAYPDPELLPLPKLRELKTMGFNYISFGIQDFNERVLRAINRSFRCEEAKALIAAALDMDFTVNLDLCYGLPYQGLGEFERSLEEARSIGPDKIVIYPYAHYPMIYPMQRNIPLLSLPNTYIKSLQLGLARQMLGESYERQGMDTFVRRNGRASGDGQGKGLVRNFMGSSERGSPNLFGCGQSAISRIGNLYFQNAAQPDLYGSMLESGRLPLQWDRVHRMSQDDLIREELIEKQLLARFQVDKKTFLHLFRVGFDEYFKPEWKQLQDLERDGLLEGLETEVLSATEAGTYFLRTVAHIFDPYYSSHRNGELKHDG